MESNSHLKLVVDQYGFQVSEEPFERTYRVGLIDEPKMVFMIILNILSLDMAVVLTMSKGYSCGHYVKIRRIKLVRDYDHVLPKDLIDGWIMFR